VACLVARKHISGSIGLKNHLFDSARRMVSLYGTNSMSKVGPLETFKSAVSNGVS
jgi:hypothetical protein